MEFEKLTPTNDLIFQNIFGRAENEKITKGFLEKVLGTKIEGLTLDTNKRLIGKEIDDKIGRIDVKAKLNDGTKVFIEMQVAEYKYMAKRMLYYWSETYVGSLKRGETYDDLRKTIGILISVENLPGLEEIEEYHTKWEIIDKEHMKSRFTEDLELHVIELSKFKEGKEKRPEDNWIKFIKAKGVEEMKELRDIDAEMKAAVEELERLTADPELREIYYQRIVDLRDKLSYGKAGIEEGRAEEKKEVILNMHKRRMPVEEISSIVNLSKEEVEEIINKSSKN